MLEWLNLSREKVSMLLFLRKKQRRWLKGYVFYRMCAFSRGCLIQRWRASSFVRMKVAEIENVFQLRSTDLVDVNSSTGLRFLKKKNLYPGLIVALKLLYCLSVS